VLGKVAIRVIPALATLAALLLSSAGAAAAQSQTIETVGWNGDVRIQVDPTLAYGAATSRLPVSFRASGECAAGDSYLYQSFPPGTGIGFNGPVIDGANVYAAPISLTGLGYCTIVASQPGDATYAPAPDVSATFKIVPPNVQTWITRVPARGRSSKHSPRLRHHRYVLEFQSQPDVSGFACSQDGRPFTPCSSPVVLRNLAPGMHRFTVKSIVKGVEAANPAAIKFRVHGRSR
jgi:hypothetical protein